MGQRPLVMWSAVCSAPHSQLLFVDNPQRSMLAPNVPTPVRSRVQARRDRPTPCPLCDGVGMNLCSLVVVDARIGLCYHFIIFKLRCSTFEFSLFLLPVCRLHL